MMEVLITVLAGQGITIGLLVAIYSRVGHLEGLHESMNDRIEGLEERVDHLEQLSRV